MHFIILALLLVFTAAISHCQDFISGYHISIQGEELTYHSPQPDAKVSLLVRSDDSTRFIAWETAIVPIDFQEDTATFLMLAGIDVNPGDPHRWKFLVNEKHLFTISSPLDTIRKHLSWTAPAGARLEFNVTEVDKYGDFMGYLFLHLPVSMIEKGMPVRLKVTGEQAGSRTWFMVFMYKTLEKVSLIAENAVERTSWGNMQVLRATVVHYGEPVHAEIKVGDSEFERRISFGHHCLTVPFPEITRDTVVPVRISAGDQVMYDTVFTLQPVVHRTIFLLHHSHNDIGYTHVQTEVEQMQWKNLADAVRLAEATKDYPAGAQFKWNTEVMWAVVSYLEQAPAEEKQAFINAMKNGMIELHGLFANELVSLCEPEELLWLMEPARRIARESGINLTSAMITDIPGWSWGLVPALAHSGVKYLSLGTNTGHRIGNTIKQWGDRPFYWVSPSGEEKVLCWIHETGYSLFHTGLDYRKIRTRLRDDLVFEYMNQLAARNYPYDMVMLRYTIGSDNGPVDEFLPDAVKDWNEHFITPEIVISTVGEAFSLFEEKYGQTLPEVRGDFTAYWEDGAYSTARETVLNRASASRLNQAQTLRSMMGSIDYPSERFREAWRNILLFDEHTWGSWNSISEPESDFTLSQWAIKERFARNAHQQSTTLFIESFPELDPADLPLDEFEVLNTCSWARSGLVSVPAELLPPAPVIRDSHGNSIPVQRLSDGQWVFLARDIPPLGSARFQAEPSKTLFRLPDEGAPVPDLSNQDFELQVSDETGAITNLTWKETGSNLADISQWSGLNEFIYVAGRSPEIAQRIDRVRIKMGEDGPVVRSVRILSIPPGCRMMETEITLVSGMGTVYVNNTIDKEKIYDPEAVHFAFPFKVPDGVMRYDLAFGHCEVEKDQIKGSNRNFITMESWIDISNDDFGVTVACPDAALFEVGEITMDEIVTGWVEQLKPSQTFFSYVMNNYWETNYAAAQEGIVSFNYVIKPHRGFDPAAAERFGIESRQPLVALPVQSAKFKVQSSTANGKRQTVNDKLQTAPSLLVVPDTNIILVSLKPTSEQDEFVACLYNASDQEIKIELAQKNTGFFLSDIDGITKSSKIDELTFPPKGIRFVMIVK